MPETMFLHNPERILTSTDPTENRDRLAAALAQAQAAELRRSWGFSTWDARPLAAVVADAAKNSRISCPSRLFCLQATPASSQGQPNVSAAVSMPPASPNRWARARIISAHTQDGEIGSPDPGIAIVVLE
ncbi:hypothetical protein [Amycolatopsis sp. NPDC004079]|uniref:hypothetical protein n=1 Tax=Amycolatopsis sp. NPDC004079 TaxID=3154549 RepID=UPI0033AC57E4